MTENEGHTVEDEQQEEYTVDVWVRQQYSVRVSANSEEEAAEIAEDRVDDEHWPEEVLSSKVI